jgi:hypothetical protein
MADADEGLDRQGALGPTQGDEGDDGVPADGDATTTTRPTVADADEGPAAGTESPPTDAAAQTAGAGAGDDVGDDPTAGATARGPYVELAQRLAAAYTSLGRVDDENRWAPFLCRIPEPSTARFSDSADDGTHGQKLYTVYALHPDKYAGFAAGRGVGAPVDPDPFEGLERLLVKESWTVREADSSQPVLMSEVGAWLRPAERDGKYYIADQLAGLYMLIKLTDDAPDTDEGWVYATVSADGSRVTAGLEDSCMGCHRQAPHERLFGLPGLPPPDYE